MPIPVRTPSAVSAALVFLFSSPWAMAATTELVDCRALTVGSERLACYDRVVSAQTEPVANAFEAVPAPAGDSAKAVVVGDAAAPSVLGKAWELDSGQRGHTLRIRQYKPVYVLPLFYATSPNHTPSSPAAGHSVDTPLDLDSREAKLQFSLKAKIFEDVFGDNGDLWFGYTQASHWQVYDGEQSRPFRETTYEPELMFTWRTEYNVLGWRGRLLNLGLNHQSNGRSLPLSRSWNRVMLSTSLERDNWTMTLRPWWRIPEADSRDDNPDIANYMGRADLQLVRTSGDHQFSVLLRHSLRGGDRSHGAVQMDYAFPIAGDLRGHLQWFSGYGESLVDYNHRGNYFGVGLSLLEWY